MAKKKKATADEAVPVEEGRDLTPTVSLNFPEGCGVEPKGFGDMNVDEMVTVVLKGKVTEIRHSVDRWDRGKHFSLKLSAVNVKGPAKKGVSMDEALEASATKV